MHYIEYQNHKVAYNTSGEGEGIPVVFVHGFCEDSRMWNDWLTHLPGYRRYLLIDLPGFGQSEPVKDLTIEYMAETIHAVLQHENIGKCLLCGHSMGGYASLAFAEKYGHALAGLSLFHSSAYADTEEKKASRLKSLDFIRNNGHILFVRQLIPKLFAYDYSKGYQAEVNRMIYYACEYPEEAIIAALHAMRQRPDRSHVLKNLSCPVQFLIGKKDVAIPYELSLAQSYLPDRSDIRIFQSVGHMGMFKSPHETARAFREFMNRVDPV